MPDEASASPSSSDRDPIERLADSFIGRFRAGERPSVEEYALKYPELAGEIRDLLPALVELELNDPPGGEATGSVVGLRADASGAAPQQLGDYLILREIGRGGMGVVYEAVQQSLGRHVALKVLPASSLAGSSHLERFRLEARSAARLHHTNIVPVFGVGDQDGVHYYAMQFIRGQGLDEVFEELRRLKAVRSRAAATDEPCRSGPDRARTLAATHGLLTGQFRAGGEGVEPVAVAVAPVDGAEASITEAPTTGSGPAPPRPEAPDGSGASHHSQLSSTRAETPYYRSVARVSLQVAEALAHAHSQGILHRDIKPSNLLLDANGTVWVTDFGLAKAEGTDALTHTGDIVGTLRYMAPERFDGWSDPRSDVYALGATLYELLTLRHLFEEANRAKLIDRVIHDVPAPPRKLDRRVPRDLETIVLKAIAKEPAHRYATAEQMAEDLRRFLADKPVRARRSGPIEQAWRWCRRNKGLAAGIAVALVGLMAAVVVLAISNLRIARTSRALAAAVEEKEGALISARRSEALAKTSAADRDRQRLRAEAGEAQARAAVDQFLTRVTEDALLKAPGLQSLRRDLLRSALRFYDEFLEQRGGDPRLRAALADVQLRVGKIQQDLGDGAGARKSFLAAREIYRALTGEKPDDRDVRAGLADCQFRLNAIPEAIAIYEKLIKLDPTNPRYRRGLAEGYNSQATGQIDPNRVAEVLEAHRKALALREGLVREFPEDAEARNHLGGTLNNLGTVLNQQGHQQDALAMFRRAAEQGEIAFARTPQIGQYGLYLGIQYANVASTLQALGRHDEANPAYRRLIEHLRAVSRANPEVPIFRARLHLAAGEFARYLIAQGRKSEAVEAIRLAAATLEDGPRKTGSDLYNLACFQALLAAGIRTAPAGTGAEDLRERERLIAASVDSLRRAIEMGSVPAAHLRTDPDLEILRDRGDFRALVARQQAIDDAAALDTRVASGTPEERLKAGRGAIAARTRLVEDEPRNRRHRADLAASRHALGRILADLNRFDEAEKALNEARAAREDLAREQPASIRDRLDVNWTGLALGTMYWKAARLDRADREWRAALQGMETALRELPGDDPLRNELDDARIEVVDGLLQLGLWEEAGEMLDRVFRRQPSGLAKDLGHQWHVHAMLRLLAGDAAGFRASCGEFYRAFAENDNKFNLYRATLAGPDPLGPEDLKSLIGSAGKDLEKNPRDNWFILFLGMNLARAGRFEEALTVLDLGRPEYRQAVPLFGMRAIVLHHLGRHDEARRALVDADRDLEQAYRDALAASGPILIPLPFEVILREVIRREAHSLIEGKPTADAPDRRLLRARVLAQMGRKVDAEKERATSHSD